MLFHRDFDWLAVKHDLVFAEALGKSLKELTLKWSAFYCSNGEVTPSLKVSCQSLLLLNISTFSCMAVTLLQMQ